MFAVGYFAKGNVLETVHICNVRTLIYAYDVVDAISAAFREDGYTVRERFSTRPNEVNNRLGIAVVEELNYTIFVEREG